MYLCVFVCKFIHCSISDFYVAIVFRTYSSLGWLQQKIILEQMNYTKSADVFFILLWGLLCAGYDFPVEFMSKY